MASDNPIGVFDSGVGGISVLREIRRELPHEDLLYLADSAHAPYGAKSAEYIIGRSLACARFLGDHGAKAVVVACNTATAAAVTELRHQFDLPVIAMEPAVKPAVAQSRNGIIGVLATAGTLSSYKFSNLVRQFATDVQVITQPCPGLVEHIERGNLDSLALRKLLTRFMAPLLDRGADTLILGCTHYPLVRHQIESIAGPGVQIIDSGAAVARQLSRQLHAHGLLRDTPHSGCERFWTSGDPDQVQRVIRELWGGGIEVGQMQ